MNNLLISFFVLFIISGCAAQKSSKKAGTLSGIIGLFEGNCMPGPGVPPCEAKPISTTLYITSPAKDFEFKNLVDSVVSNNKGFYTIELKVGIYSLFLRDDKHIVCIDMQCNPECVCTPIEISGGKKETRDLNLNHAIW